MELNPLTAISPIDGRYRNKVAELSQFFSEHALFQYRVHVEIEYFISLSKISLEQIPALNENKITELRKIHENFSESDSQQIKLIEQEINHDVKAVEYFVKRKLIQAGLSKTQEFVHFGLTSQDINNTAVPLSLKAAHEQAYLPQLDFLFEKIMTLADSWKNVAMLARTHGQPASPTSVGKELRGFAERIDKQSLTLKTFSFEAKFGGATGNFNAHRVAFPKIDWRNFADEFITGLGLKRQQTTTQIEHYDQLASLFDNYKRINTILIDLCRDLWTYVSMDYFKQKLNKSEVGSSAMPHKVNPIDFENAEGNLGIANAFFTHLSAKLPVSRLQRDLTDSTVLRNVGVPVSHTILAFHSLQKGLSKLLLNKEKIEADLEQNWQVIAEAIQTVLRRERVTGSYEKLKELSRKNEKMVEHDFHSFIDSLEIASAIKTELKAITPQNYTGYSLAEN